MIKRVPRADTMSPAQFKVGVIVAGVFWILLYSWLLQSVFTVTTDWTLAIIGVMAVAWAVMGVFGYRLWLSHRAPEANPLVVDRSRVTRLLLLSIVLACLVWISIYLFTSGFKTIAGMVGLGTVVTALGMARELTQTFGGMVASQSRGRYEFQRNFGIFMIGFNALLFLAMAGQLVIVERVPELALVPFTISLALGFLAWRKIHT